MSSCHSSPFSAGGYFGASGGRPLAASGGVRRQWPLAGSGGLRRPRAPSGAVRRPPALSGALRRPPAPSGALRRPPAPSGALRRPPAPSSALRRPPAPSSALRWPPVTSGLWKESCNGKACNIKRDLREGGVNAQLVSHNNNILDLILNLPQTPNP